MGHAMACVIVNEHKFDITINVHVSAALFFTKIKPKIEGAAYPWIHLYFEFSKT